jgi:hypothetical protein
MAAAATSTRSKLLLATQRDPEIAARHHDAVGDPDDILQVVNGGGFLQFGRAQRAPGLRAASCEELGFARDSSLEEAGFEPSVPLAKVSLSLMEQEVPQRRKKQSRNRRLT